MITAIPPKVVPNAMYRVGQAAKILGVNRHTISNYVKKSHLHPKYDSISGRKLFEGRDIARFWESRLVSSF